MRTGGIQNGNFYHLNSITENAISLILQRKEDSDISKATIKTNSQATDNDGNQTNQ